MKAAVKSGGVLDNDNYWAYVKDPEMAANAMWKATGMEGMWRYSRRNTSSMSNKEHYEHIIYGVGNSTIEHFVNNAKCGPNDRTNCEIYDVWDGNQKVINDREAGYDGRQILRNDMLMFYKMPCPKNQIRMNNN